MRPPNGKSPYDKFQALLADSLNVPLSHVAVFSVMNSEDGFTDVRYSAHGSPWYPASMLDGIVSLEKEKVVTKQFLFLCYFISRGTSEQIRHTQACCNIQIIILYC